MARWGAVHTEGPDPPPQTASRQPPTHRMWCAPSSGSTLVSCLGFRHSSPIATGPLHIQSSLAWQTSPARTLPPHGSVLSTLPSSLGLTASSQKSPSASEWGAVLSGSLSVLDCGAWGPAHSRCSRNVGWVNEVPGPHRSLGNKESRSRHFSAWQIPVHPAMAWLPGPSPLLRGL